MVFFNNIFVISFISKSFDQQHFLIFESPIHWIENNFWTLGVGDVSSNVNFHYNFELMTYAIVLLYHSPLLSEADIYEVLATLKPNPTTGRNSGPTFVINRLFLRICQTSALYFQSYNQNRKVSVQYEIFQIG